VLLIVMHRPCAAAASQPVSCYRPTAVKRSWQQKYARICGKMWLFL